MLSLKLLQVDNYLSAIFKHCPGKNVVVFYKISQVLRELAFRGVLGHAYPENL